MKRQQEEFTALYCRLSQEDGREGESNSIVNQEGICKKSKEKWGDRKGMKIGPSPQ